MDGIKRKIESVREAYISRKMYSELCGFDAGVKLFADKEQRATPSKINTRNPRVIAARKNMIYKPSKYMVYEKIKEGDKEWLKTCFLAYPDVYNQGYEFFAMQNAQKII